MCDFMAGSGEWKEIIDGKEEIVKKDGEVDVLLMEKDAAGAATHVLAIAEMKSGAYDLACGEEQHKQYVCPGCKVAAVPSASLHDTDTSPMPACDCSSTSVLSSVLPRALKQASQYLQTRRSSLPR
jgi:hypothetical protein